MLRTSQNASSPLVKANQPTAPQGNQVAQVQQPNNPTTIPKGKRGAQPQDPIIIGGNSGYKKSKYQTVVSQKPNDGNTAPIQKKRYCAFCKAAYPKSKTCDTHYPIKCFRNPQSKAYDQVKAAVPPKN
jgi:hypothetical protein